MPAISVLLPVFNGERFLADAVESILAQSFVDFELLALNDGSTDGSEQILRKFAERDTRVRVFSRENRGLVATLNQLIDASRGELLARMDADDIALPDRFARQVDFMRQHPAVVCVGGATEMIDEKGRYLTTLFMPQRNVDIQAKLLAGHAAVSHPSVMLRRLPMKQLGGYRADFYPAEDLDLWLRLGEWGDLANLAAPVIRYRLHGGSISGSNVEKQRAAARRACESAWQRRGIPDARFDAGDSWRPTAEAGSQQQFALQYGWWAFNSGQRATSLAYAAKAIRHRPLGKEGWRLMLVSMCKPMKPRVRR